MQPNSGILLIEMAGGLSLNKQENFRESSHAEYTVDQLNRLNPDIILISGHFAPPIDEFLATCKDLGISCKATTEGDVYAMDSEFSSGDLGWLVSLMDVANILHPEIFTYSLKEEKEKIEREIKQIQGEYRWK